MKNVTLKINNTSVTVPEGTRILDAARQAGYDIPTLCYLKDLTNEGSCRMCVVEVKGARSLVVSCVGTVAEGMEVFTNTPKVISSRKTTLELMLSNHKRECLSCVRSTNCELQKLALEYGCDDKRFEGEHTHVTVEAVNPYLVRDNDKCILCRRCVAMCSKIQSVGVIGANRRGFNTEIGCAFNRNLGDVDCVACGQCIKVCPTGALTEVDDTAKVVEALNDPDKYVIFGTAPSVRVALGEEFGNPIGTDVEGKMVAAIKRFGADKVFDVNMTADLTIMEEGTELLERLADKNAVLPMITSCSPGWIRFIEFNYPELLGHLSSCKSPQQMFGAVMKTYYAKANNIDPKNIYVVSCMPCTAKKEEILRDDQAASGYPDVDVVLTTRELARLIKKYGINFNNLPNEQFDDPIGYGTTAGLIFGATGGVMEAALRTAAYVLTGENPNPDAFSEVRTGPGLREATYTVAGIPVRCAVVSGLGNARKLIERLKEGKVQYDFVEVMACPGGCVGGGGQPISAEDEELYGVRGERLYTLDAENPMRFSHENPEVQALYHEYLGEPLGETAHHLLHTDHKAWNMPMQK